MYKSLLRYDILSSLSGFHNKDRVSTATEHVIIQV